MDKTRIATLAGLLGYSIFGFSFLFCKIALEQTSPLTLISLRFVLAFLVFQLVLWMGKVKMNFRGKPVKTLLLMGFVQPVFYFITETYGVAMTSASFSGVMIGLAPVVGLIFGVLLLKERCTGLQIACTLLSVAGVALTTTGGFGTVSVVGFLLLMGAVIAAALFAILSRSVAPYFSAFERTYINLAFGSVVFTAIALFENRGDLSVMVRPLGISSFWISLLYLSVFSSVCAFLLINFSLSHVSAGKVLIFNNFTTVISVLAGILIMKDTFTWIQRVGIVLIIVGVFGVSYQKQPEAAKP